MLPCSEESGSIPSNSLISFEGMGTTALQRKIMIKASTRKNSIAVENYGYEEPAHRRLIPSEEERRMSKAPKRQVWLFLYDDSSYSWNALRIAAMAPLRERNIFGLIRVDPTSYIIAFIPIAQGLEKE